MLEIDLKPKTNTNNNEVVLVEFKGSLSQNILIEISDIIIKRVAVDKTIKIIFAVFVELAQNIMHYSAEKDIIDAKEIGVGKIVFSEHEDYYGICSVNHILNTNHEKLTKHIEKINSMNQDELKSFYKESRRRNTDNESKGAGLGLIDIARKSKNILEYSTKLIDKNTSFLSIKIKIRKVKVNG